MPIEQVSPEFERIVSRDQNLEWLASGLGILGGPADPGTGPAEGPLWWKEGEYLLFSDIGHNQRLKWTRGEGITVFREGTDYANGLTRDRQGRLIACEHSSHRVTRLEPDGSITVVANNYQDRRLNRPNDVVVKSDGSIYFTDPGAPDTGLDLEFAGVYRVSPDLGTITLLVRDFVVPNGLTFSPDESILYIDDSRRGHIRAFDVQPSGVLALASDRIFADLSGDRPGVPDGMKVDAEGNVFSTGPGGVWVIDPNGKHLGTILTGANQTTNVGWGGEDWKTLFITTYQELACIRLKIPGVPVP